MFKKITLLFFITIMVNSCSGSGENWKAVKRGLTGGKNTSSDEFLVKTKDPLILPPDFETLPTPKERSEVVEEISSFEKKLTKTSIDVGSTSTTNSTEESILQEIKKK